MPERFFVNFFIDHLQVVLSIYHEILLICIKIAISLPFVHAKNLIILVSPSWKNCSCYCAV